KVGKLGGDSLAQNQAAVLANALDNHGFIARKLLRRHGCARIGYKTVNMEDVLDAHKQAKKQRSRIQIGIFGKELVGSGMQAFATPHFGQQTLHLWLGAVNMAQSAVDV